MDVLISSGFLAFARHLGFRKAFEARHGHPDAICGTSSGSVIGALWAAGVSIEQCVQLTHVARPIWMLTPNLAFWKGAFRLDQLMKRLEPHLPQRIEDLPMPFGVGVFDPQRQHKLLTSGPLVPALAASCAIPYLFAPVKIDGVEYGDGGFVDRIGAQAWRQLRPDAQCVAHMVDRSNGAADEVGLEGVTVVRTPRSFASFWSMGPYAEQMVEAEKLSLAQLPQH